MTNALQVGKRALTVGVAVSTIAWSIGLATFIVPLTAKAATLTSGDLIKASLPAVYYYGANGKRYVFPNEKTYFTWYTNFLAVRTITDAELAAVPIGGNVTYRPGVKMVKITTDPKTYAVAKNGTLRWVTSESLAAALYGVNWNTQSVHDVPDAFFVDYTVGANINSTADYDKNAETAAAVSINVDKGLVAPAPVAQGLTVSLASDNPAGGSIVADSDNDTNGSSQRAPMLKMRFTATGGAAKVTQLKFRRSGIAADSDVDALRLYDNWEVVAQNNSLAGGVATFTNSAGLFTVASGASLDLTLKMDIDNNTSAGKTLGWSLANADITADAASVTGSASGNLFTVASVTDLGYLEVANISPGSATTVDPQDNFELWRFKFDANDQNMLVKRVVLTNVGSVDSDDLQNFKLMDGGTQLGSTIVLATNNKLTFDLTGMADGGLKMLSGTTKQLSLRGDIKGGTNRTFRWSIQNTTDVVAWDLNYNVETVLAGDSAAFSVTQAGGATTINTGSLTIQVHPDSPAGNVPDGATGVTLARWNLTAAGEDVQIDTLDVSCGGNASTNILKNVKLVFNGSQVGTTMTSLTCDTTSPAGTDFSFGNTFIVAAGTTKELAFNADLTDTTIASGDTLVANLVAGSSNAKGRTSLTAISTAAASGRTVTVAAGTLSVAKNSSLADYSSTRPLGVAGSLGVRVGSFVITGGAEASDVTGITLKDDLATSSDGHTLADFFVNLKVRRGATQLGTTVGTLTDTDSTTYEFSVSPAVRVGVGEQVVIDVYADIKSTLPSLTPVNTTDTGGEIIMDKTTATGLTTSTDTSYTTDVNLQDLYIAANGMLRVTIDASTPQDQQMTTGSTEQVMAQFKLSEESNAEDILVTKVVVADGITVNTASPTNSSGTLRNLKLWNGATLLGTVAALDSTTFNTLVPLAVFDLTGLAGGGLVVGKSANVVLTVKADITPWADNASSSSTHRLFLPGGSTNVGGAGDWNRTNTTVDDSIVATGKGSGASISSTDASSTSGLLLGPTSGTTTSHVNANVMDVMRAKLTVAHAGDAPSGLQTKSSEATVAKFVFSNSSPGGYAVTLKLLNLDINQSGISITAARTLRIYKDSIDAANQLATTSFNNENYSDTQFAAGDFTDVEVAAGSSKTLIVTLDTSDSSIGSNDTLSVGIQTGATGEQSAVIWSDGALAGNLGNPLGYTEINSLPLAGKTLSY